MAASSPTSDASGELAPRLVALLALAAAALLWLSGPPLNLWLLVWLAPVPLLALARATRHPGRWGYFWLWAIGSGYWLLALQGVRLANPALYPGWIALGLYLGVYFPLVVGLARVAVHELRWPLLLAAPAVWVGLELIRGYALTGFSAVMLGHALVHWPAGFQVVDLGGSYAASALVAAVAAGVTGLGAAAGGAPFPGGTGGRGGRTGRAAGAGVATVLILAAAWGYGRWRIGQAEQSATADSLLSVALVQCDTPAIFEFNPDRDARSFADYRRQTEAAMRSEPAADLVVWPESVFTAGQPRYRLAEDFAVPEDVPLSPSEFASHVDARQAEFDARVGDLQRVATAASGRRREPPQLLLGAAMVEFGPQGPRTYNAALHFDPAARLVDWYGKRHLVMFGEYIPLGGWLPWLYEIGPLRYGVAPGPRDVGVEVDGVRVAPSICFETMVERVTNRQVRGLTAAGKRPDVLVNLTNDGWFRGSSILDHHLRCTQAAAAANRVPILVAANGGITAWVDSSGRVREALPRKTEGFVIARPTRDERVSLYARIGDWPARALGLLCVGLAVTGRRRRPRSERAEARPGSERNRRS